MSFETVALVPMLVREFQIISGQHVSFGVLESLFLNWPLIHHAALVLHTYIIYCIMCILF